MSAGWRVKIYSLAARSTVMTMVLEVGAVGFGWGRSILQRGALEPASLRLPAGWQFHSIS